MTEEFIGRLVIAAITGLAWGYHQRKIKTLNSEIFKLRQKVIAVECFAECLRDHVWSFHRRLQRLNELEDKVNGVITIQTKGGFQKVYKNPCDLEQPIEEM